MASFAPGPPASHVCFRSSLRTSVGPFPCPVSLHFRQEFCGCRSQAKELSVWVHLHRGPQGHPYLSGPRGSGGLPGSSPGQWQRRPRASEAPAAASGPMVPAARESGSPTVGAQSRSPAERAHLPARTAPGLKPGAGRGGDSGKLRSPTGEGGGEGRGPPEGGRGSGGWSGEDLEGRLKEESLLRTAGRGVCPEWRRDKRKPGGVTGGAGSSGPDRPQTRPSRRAGGGCAPQRLSPPPSSS